MKRLPFLLSLALVPLIAAQLSVGGPIASLQQFAYEDPFEKKATIADHTRLVLVSFEKQSGDIAADFFNARAADLLARNSAVYIADIHKMPAIVTYLFARPKMKKYTFPLHLYTKGEAFEKSVPHKEGKLTVIRFDAEQKVASVRFVGSGKELEALFAQ
jgi:hypothetical protein